MKITPFMVEEVTYTYIVAPLEEQSHSFQTAAGTPKLSSTVGDGMRGLVIDSNTDTGRNTARRR